MAPSWGNRCLLVVTLGLGLAVADTPHMALAEDTSAEEVVTPLVATPIASPNPVLGADDKVHLAYEMVLLNMAPGDIGLLGLLGNSGNTDTPHLHFHVMDGPSPLVANGLPYVFANFAGQGRLTDEQPLFTGGTVTIDKDALSGPHQNQMPLADQVVSFP